MTDQKAKAPSVRMSLLQFLKTEPGADKEKLPRMNVYKRELMFLALSV
jgi:hypothetical protein